MSGLSDAELLARFRAGKDCALEALFDRYETPLYNFLLGMLRNSHQAEDVLQETFVRALQNLDAVDPAHLRGWLFTVGYHQAMLYKRRNACQRRHLGSSLPVSGAEVNGLTDSHPGPLERSEQEDDARRLRALLDQLPDPQREVICQRIYEGKKFREIAQSLRCPLNTALARMHEGLKRLRLLWGENHA